MEEKEEEMRYFVDYKGMIDPAHTEREHVGVFSWCGPSKMIMVRPGLQEVPAALWHDVRQARQIGWDPEAKKYTGPLVENGTITVYECKVGKMDWGKLESSLADLSRRTTVVSILRDMLAYIETRPALTFLASRLRKHIETCSVGFDDKPLTEEQMTPRLEVA